jgi:hypothetical protein
MPSREKLAEFTAWCAKPIAGDQSFRSGILAQFFLDRRFQAFGEFAGLDAGGLQWRVVLGQVAQFLELRAEVG